MAAFEVTTEDEIHPPRLGRCGQPYIARLSDTLVSG